MKLIELNSPKHGGLNYWVDIDSFKSEIRFYDRRKEDAKYCSIIVFCRCKRSSINYNFWMSAHPEDKNSMASYMWYWGETDLRSNGWFIDSSNIICPGCVRPVDMLDIYNCPSCRNSSDEKYKQGINNMNKNMHELVLEHWNENEKYVQDIICNFEEYKKLGKDLFYEKINRVKIGNNACAYCSEYLSDMCIKCPIMIIKNVRCYESIWLEVCLSFLVIKNRLSNSLENSTIDLFTELLESIKQEIIFLKEVKAGMEKNLCDTCLNSYPVCGVKNTNITFDNDNIIKCDFHIQDTN
jgi:hypothetical protein